MAKVGAGKIYCLKSSQTDQVYYGSTFEKYLSERFAGHKTNYKRFQQGKAPYMTSQIIMKYDDRYIELISTHENVTKDELRVFERRAIENDSNACNKVIPARGKKESDSHYYYKNADKIKERVNQYRLNNIDKIKEKKERRRVCDCGGQYQHANHHRHIKTKKHLKWLLEKDNYNEV